MNWLFRQCGRYEKGLGLLAADALAKSERAEVETHVANCAFCQTELAELQNLACGLSRAGQALPRVEAPVSLRRRWMTEVRTPGRERNSVPTSLVPAWLSGRRVAWGGLATIWALVLFFRFSAPDVAKPAVFASAPPISLHEVLLTLAVDDRKAVRRADAANPERRPESRPDALPPRSQRSPARLADLEVA